MIKIYHLKKRFPTKGVIFDDLTISVPAGEFVLLYGDSGCGKSSLLRIVAGFLRPDEGQVIIAGRNLNELDARGLRALRREVSLVPQEVVLLDDRSIEENITLAMRIRDKGGRPARAECRRWLEAFALCDFANALPRDLSRGEQVKVMLARAMAAGPKLLLVDEPEAQLDMESAKTVMRALGERHGQGMTIMMATKDPNLLINGSTRLVELSGGRVVERW